MSDDTIWIEHHRPRNRGMVEAFNAGTGFKELATLHGLSPERVRRILNQAGCKVRGELFDLEYQARALKVAAELAGANVAQIKLFWRNRPLVRARWAYMAAMRKRGMSYPDIGKSLCRDHSTVVYGCEQAGHMAKRSPEFAQMLALVEAA